jgi:hypothetical protein
VELLDPASGKSTVIGKVEKLTSLAFGFTVSPDGSTVLIPGIAQLGGRI